MLCKRICGSRKRKTGVMCVLLFALIFYSYNLAMTGLVENVHTNSASECVPLDKWLFLNKYMTLADTFNTILVPFMLISIVNILIVIKLARTTRSTPQNESSNHIFANNSSMHKKMEMSNNFTTVTTSHLINSASCHHQQTTNKKGSLTQIKLMMHDVSRKRKYSRTTVVLMSISSAFLALNFPIATCKIFNYFSGKTFEPDSSGMDSVMGSVMAVDDSSIYLMPIYSRIFKNISEALNETLSNHQIEANNASGGVERPSLVPVITWSSLFERLAGNVYYLNFVLNFFLYSLNGSKFRQNLAKIMAFRLFKSLNK